MNTFPLVSCTTVDGENVYDTNVIWDQLERDGKASISFGNCLGSRLKLFGQLRHESQEYGVKLRYDHRQLKTDDVIPLHTRMKISLRRATDFDAVNQAGLVY